MKKVLKYTLRAFDALLLFVLIIVLCLASIYFVNATTNKSTFPDVFGYAPIIVISGSMEPTIKVNDIVIVKKTHYSELNPGDIIVYFDKLRNMTIIHRLIEIKNGKAVTKGDANFAADIPFSVTQIYGKQVLIIPYLGQVIEYLKTHIFITYLCIAVLIAYIFFLVTKTKYAKNK